MELLSPFHLIVILAVVVLLFGGRKIPEVMRGMGEGIRSFKDGMRGDSNATPTQTTPTLSLSVSPNPASLGQPVTLTANVSPAPSGASLGTVTFFNGATLLGTGNVNANGVANLTYGGLPAGALHLTAAYSGNTTLSAASAVAAVTVNSSVPVTT
jgi:TatA/E family protein of Tat protein translocase